MQRRLAAILAADVVGYSRLMGKDEAGTLERLKLLRSELVQPKVVEHQGRVVKLMGDGLLAVFPSVIEAVRCAVAIQRGMTARESGTDEESRIRLRIGVNLGDIIVEASDVYGDGVNVAARLEGLAEPGGICVSGTAFDTIDGKLGLEFEDIGPQQLKNIAKAIRVYRLTPDRAPGGRASDAAEHLQPQDKPAIAVLPLDNLSGAPDQEYFADGITEDIITELSRFKNLFVIARNSSFVFKGQAVDVKEIGRKLGVGYVVEGSVRKSGNRVRVTAQLVETSSGKHIWAERYDRVLEDIFEVQDELVREIAAAVPGQVDAAALALNRRRPRMSLAAYDYVLRGWALARTNFGSREAASLFEKAIEIDAQCAQAYTNLAMHHAYSLFAHGTAFEQSAQLARSLAERALTIDRSDPRVHATAAQAYIMVGEHELARRHALKAIELNPNDFLVMHYVGNVLTYLGEHDEGLKWRLRQSRHDPFEGDSVREGLFDVSYMMHRYEDAITAFRGWHQPPPHMYGELAAAYAQAGRVDEARDAMVRYAKSRPDDYDPVQVAITHSRMCARAEDRDHWLDGYRKAGLEL